MHSPGIPRHKLQDDVISPAEFAEKPVFGLRPKWRRTLEENPAEQRLAIRRENILLEAVPIKFGHALEEVPKE
jgi:hypothetical protein